MAIDYDETDQFKALAPILEEDTIWFADVAKAVAFPDNFENNISRPSSFESWHEAAQQDENMNAGVLRDLSDAHQQMVMEGMAILEGIDSGQKPSHEIFESFVDCFHLYSKRMRGLELDSALEGSGVDQFTGLRLIKMLDGDMKRELERLERQGTEFCLTMFRIDGFDVTADVGRAVTLTTKHIKGTIRPFDDAYYAGEGYFVLSMKQTDIIGAEAGINRLSLNLKQDADNQNNISLTFCLVEPSIGDEASDLIKKMRQDLDENKDARDTVLKFKEISDLERYVGSLGR